MTSTINGTQKQQEINIKPTTNCIHSSHTNTYSRRKIKGAVKRNNNLILCCRQSLAPFEYIIIIIMYLFVYSTIILFVWNEFST